MTRDEAVTAWNARPGFKIREIGVVPPDALTHGDWIEASDGRIGVVLQHGWDSEGSFGYLLSVGPHNGAVWAYHHAQAKAVRNPLRLMGIPMKNR